MAVKEEKTPWNPSKTATARVREPAPIPETCRYCGSKVVIKSHQEVYGREYNDWPWMYKCEDDACDSSVGMHPYTNIPLGTLANSSLRKIRTAHKPRFESLWNGGWMTRNEAYLWLAHKMGLSREECHFGLFEEDACTKASAICLEFFENPRKGLLLLDRLNAEEPLRQDVAVVRKKILKSMKSRGMGTHGLRRE